MPAYLITLALTVVFFGLEVVADVNGYPIPTEVLLGTFVGGLLITFFAFIGRDLTPQSSGTKSEVESHHNRFNQTPRY